MKLYYIAVALDLCERTVCDHEHRKASGARRCAERFTRDPELGQRLVRVFGYDREGEMGIDGPEYREDVN